MTAIVERELLRSDDAPVPQDESPTAGELRPKSGFSNGQVVAIGLIAVYALHAWVFQVEGATSLPRRATLFAITALSLALVSFAGARLSRRTRAWGTLFIGIAAITTTGPVVGSHLAKLGIDGIAVTGAIAAISASFLTASAGIWLVRSARTLPRKLSAIPIAFILLQFVAYPFGSAIYTTQAAHPRLGTRTPADVGLKYETVVLVSQDGTRLAGWYVPSGNGASVIVRHGSGSTRTATLDHAAFLARNGFGVLMTDARGHGESGGRINELGWHGIEDIDAAVGFLESRSDVTRRVGILGQSMGGEEALNAAAGDRRIAAVVAEGAGVSNYSDSVANGAHAMARFINRAQYQLTDLLSDAPQPTGIVASMPKIAPRPVLLITGNETVEKTMGPLYAAAGGATTRLWSLPDTPHTHGLRVHPSEYQKRVLAIFEGALLRPIRD